MPRARLARPACPARSRWTPPSSAETPRAPRRRRDRELPAISTPGRREYPARTWSTRSPAPSPQALRRPCHHRLRTLLLGDDASLRMIARTDRAPSCPTCRAPLYHENPVDGPSTPPWWTSSSASSATSFADARASEPGDGLDVGDGRGPGGTRERALALRPRRHHPRAGDHVERVRGAIQTDGSEVSAGIAQVRDGGSDSRRERRPRATKPATTKPTPPATTPATEPHGRV